MPASSSLVRALVSPSMSPDPPTPPAPIAWHRAGDPASVNDILTRSQDRLICLTRRMLRGFPAVRRQNETCDVYGEVVPRLLAALRQLSFATPADFLCLAARHIRLTLIDLARQARAVPAQGVDADAAPADSTSDPVKLAMWQEFHLGVAAAPADELQLFELLYYQGFSLPDVSRLLGVPLSTLKTRWQNARANLMLRLKNELPV